MICPMLKNRQNENKCTKFDLKKTIITFTMKDQGLKTKVSEEVSIFTYIPDLKGLHKIFKS